jgi:hypothetical protein
MINIRRRFADVVTTRRRRWLALRLRAVIGRASLVAALCYAAAGAAAAGVEVEFRGCESARECRFWILASEPGADALLRVRPDGIAPDALDAARAVAVRNRLNARMSNMIHQYKHIELRDLRELGGGLFAANVVVDGESVGDDAVLRDLLREP